MICNYMRAPKLLAVLAFHLLIIVDSQSTPQERCDALGGVGTVCFDCASIAMCENDLASPISCAATGQVCDHSIVDGQCLEIASSSVSPICMCEDLGCYTDPNNADYYVSCSITNTAVTSTDVIASCTSGTVLNVQDCSCEEKECPPCGWLPIDTSNCPTEYFNCIEGEPSDEPFFCLSELCYNSTTCSCQGPPCPSCGKYVDPEVSDGTKFCYCGENSDTTCGITCSSGLVFDPISCSCTTVDCQACGQAESLDGDCSKYYSCNSDGTINDTYFCPGNQCFNKNFCACI